MMDVCRPLASITAKLSKKGASITAGENLSPIALDFNENWNTKLHGPIAAKKN
jgi:hypothetical protein